MTASPVRGNHQSAGYYHQNEGGGTWDEGRARTCRNIGRVQCKPVKKKANDTKMNQSNDLTQNEPMKKIVGLIARKESSDHCTNKQLLSRIPRFNC